MRFVVISLIAVSASFASPIASADDYIFYNYMDGTNQVTVARSESPYEACIEAEGNPIGQTGEYIVGVRFLGNGSGTCRALSSNGSIGPLTLVTDTGTCPGDEEYDFSRKRCEAGVNLKQVHAVALSAYLWMCLSAGLLVGFKAGQ